MPRLPGLPRSLYYGQIVNRASPLNRGLVSWWLNLPQRGKGNTFFDIAGRNHGTLTNGPTWQGPLGRPGGMGSLSFATASSQYVSIPQSNSLNLGTSFLFSCWIYPTSLASYRCVIDSTGRNLSLFINSTADGGYSRDDEFNSLTYSPAWTTGEWQHLAWRGTAASNFFYRNGVLCATDTGDLESVSMLTAWHIGGNPSGGGSYWNGGMDGVRLYNTEHSADFVQRLYDEELRGYPQTLNRVSPYTVFDVGGVFDGCLELQDGTGHLLLQNGTGCLAGQAAEQAVAGARLLSGGNMSSGVGIMTGGAL